MLARISNSLVLAGALTCSQALELEEIPLIRTDSSHHYLVEAKVEGDDFPLLIDSGAGMELVLSNATAEALGKIGKDGGSAKGVGGSAAMKQFNVRNLKLGSRSFRKQTTYSIELQHALLLLDGEKFPPAGLVGAPMLKRLNAVVDTRSRKLLVPPRDAGADAFLKARDTGATRTIKMSEGDYSFAFVDIEIEGETYAFLLDVGAGTNSLEPSIAEKFGLTLSEDGRDISGAGKSKAMNARRTEVEEPVIGGKIKLPKMSFDVHALHGVVPPNGKPLGGILGSRTLGALGAQVDFGSYRIIVPHFIRIDGLKQLR